MSAAARVLIASGAEGRLVVGDVGEDCVEIEADAEGDVGEDGGIEGAEEVERAECEDTVEIGELVIDVIVWDLTEMGEVCAEPAEDGEA